jgi:hypothetical protein
MSEASTSQDTGVGLSEAQAVDKLEALLSGNGHGEGDETGEDAPQTPDDDPEPDKDEGEDDGESEDDEEDAPSAQELDDATPVTVKVGDEDVSVTLHELKRGFLREQDYTRKTQALSESAKAHSVEREAFAPFVERTKALLDHLEAAYRAPLYDEQELAQLRYSDPAEFAARHAEMAERQKQVDLILGHKADLGTFDEAEKLRQAQTSLADLQEKTASAIAKAVEERPEWRTNPAEGQKAVERINAIGQSIGLDEDEWTAVRTDHRLLLVLHDAAEMRALRAKKPQIQQNLAKVKTAAPGAKSNTPSKITEVTRAKQRLAKTGSVDDAASAIERMLG